MQHSRSRATTRTLLVGGAIAILTLAGHLAGQGRIDATSAAIVVALSLAFGAAVSGRRLGLPVVLAALSGGEVIAHFVLTVSAGHAHGGTATPVPDMVVMHGAATVIAALAIVHADRLVEQWLRLLASTLGWEMDLPSVAGGPKAPASYPVLAHPALRLLADRVSRRGPPAGAIPAIT